MDTTKETYTYSQEHQNLTYEDAHETPAPHSTS